MERAAQGNDLEPRGGHNGTQHAYQRFCDEIDLGRLCRASGLGAEKWVLIEGLNQAG
jgi:hypothetical protein